LLRALTDWPIWTCYGIVGGIFVLLGGALLYSARRQISRIYVVPQQTVETMKENVRWFKRKTTLKRI
jgi:hypothetical protein